MPLSHARFTQGLPPHSPLRLPRQLLLRPKARSHPRRAGRSHPEPSVESKDYRERYALLTGRRPTSALVAAAGCSTADYGSILRRHVQRHGVTAHDAKLANHVFAPNQYSHARDPASRAGNLRLADRQRPCRPMKPSKDRPGFATIAFRTFPTLSPAPTPPAVTDALNARRERPTPIACGEPPAASFNPASKRSRLIPPGSLCAAGPI